MKKYSVTKIDTHTHTYFSFDAAENGNSPYKMCEEAIKKGLDAIIFTDHIEVNHEVEHAFPPLNIVEYKKQCAEAKKLYKGKLDVYTGAEMGQITHYPETAEEIAKTNGFDYIIGSVHIYTIDKYFDEYLQLTYVPYIDQFAHLTYPLRYIKKAGIDIDITKWDNVIEQILKNIIKNNKVYELNSVYVRKNIILPEDHILQMYKDLGGKKIRLGSDAHYIKHVAAGFAQAYELIDNIYKGEIK